MNPNDWKVKSLRFTAFLAIGSRDHFPVPGRLWDTLKLDTREGISNRNFNGVAAIGLWNGARLTVKAEGISQATPIVHPNGEAEISFSQDQARIDLLWESVWLTHSGSDLVPKFKNLVKSLISSDEFMPVNRLAIGINGGHIFKNREESYGHLSALVPWIKTDPQVRELVIRFNRPLNAKTQRRELRINRMCQFFCAMFEKKGSPEESLTAACCEADINTEPLSQENAIDKDEASTLVDRLSEIAESSIIHGDRP